jgi:ribonuclease HI
VKTVAAVTVENMTCTLNAATTPSCDIDLATLNTESATSAALLPTYATAAVQPGRDGGWAYLVLASDRRKWKGNAVSEREAWVQARTALARTGETFACVGDLAFHLDRNTNLAPARNSDPVIAQALRTAASERLEAMVNGGRNHAWRRSQRESATATIPDGATDIATDGSRRRGRRGQLATAWAWRAGFDQYAAGLCVAGASVEHSELHAVIEVFEHFDGPVAVRVDNRNVVAAVNAVLRGEKAALDVPDCGHLLDILARHQGRTNISVIWTPAHAGSLSSAHADVLANWCAKGKIAVSAPHVTCGIDAALSQKLCADPTLDRTTAA